MRQNFEIGNVCIVDRFSYMVSVIIIDLSELNCILAWNSVFMAYIVFNTLTPIIIYMQHHETGLFPQEYIIMQRICLQISVCYQPEGFFCVT
jgi:hypothetical protein